MGVPYCIVKGKARLGRLVRRKTCSTVALTQVRNCIQFLYFCFNLHLIKLYYFYDEYSRANPMIHYEIKIYLIYIYENLIFLFYFSFIKVYYHFRWILAIGPTSRRSLKPLRRTSMIDMMKSGVTGAVVYWEANLRQG